MQKNKNQLWSLKRCSCPFVRKPNIIKRDVCCRVSWKPDAYIIVIKNLIRKSSLALVFVSNLSIVGKVLYTVLIQTTCGHCMFSIIVSCEAMCFSIERINFTSASLFKKIKTRTISFIEMNLWTALITWVVFLLW